MYQSSQIPHIGTSRYALSQDRVKSYSQEKTKLVQYPRSFVKGRTAAKEGEFFLIPKQFTTAPLKSLSNPFSTIPLYKKRTSHSKRILQSLQRKRDGMNISEEMGSIVTKTEEIENESLTKGKGNKNIDSTDNVNILSGENFKSNRFNEDNANMKLRNTNYSIEMAKSLAESSNRNSVNHRYSGNFDENELNPSLTNKKYVIIERPELVIQTANVPSDNCKKSSIDGAQNNNDNGHKPKEYINSELIVVEDNTELLNEDKDDDKTKVKGRLCPNNVGGTVNFRTKTISKRKKINTYIKEEEPEKILPQRPYWDIIVHTEKLMYHPEDLQSTRRDNINLISHRAFSSFSQKEDCLVNPEEENNITENKLKKGNNYNNTEVQQNVQVLLKGEKTNEDENNLKTVKYEYLLGDNKDKGTNEEKPTETINNKKIESYNDKSNKENKNENANIQKPLKGGKRRLYPKGEMNEQDDQISNVELLSDFSKPNKPHYKVPQYKEKNSYTYSQPNNVNKQNDNVIKSKEIYLDRPIHPSEGEIISPYNTEKKPNNMYIKRDSSSGKKYITTTTGGNIPYYDTQITTDHNYESTRKPLIKKYDLGVEDYDLKCRNPNASPQKCLTPSSNINYQKVYDNVYQTEPNKSNSPDYYGKKRSIFLKENLEGLDYYGTNGKVGYNVNEYDSNFNQELYLKTVSTLSNNRCNTREFLEELTDNNLENTPNKYSKYKKYELNDRNNNYSNNITKNNNNYNLNMANLTDRPNEKFDSNSKLLIDDYTQTQNENNMNYYNIQNQENIELVNQNNKTQINTNLPEYKPSKNDDIGKKLIRLTKKEYDFEKKLKYKYNYSQTPNQRFDDWMDEFKLRNKCSSPRLNEINIAPNTEFNTEDKSEKQQPASFRDQSFNYAYHYSEEPYYYPSNQSKIKTQNEEEQNKDKSFKSIQDNSLNNSVLHQSLKQKYTKNDNNVYLSPADLYYNTPHNDSSYTYEIVSKKKFNNANNFTKNDFSQNKHAFEHSDIFHDLLQKRQNSDKKFKTLQDKNNKSHMNYSVGKVITGDTTKDEVVRQIQKNNSFYKIPNCKTEERLKRNTSAKVKENPLVCRRCKCKLGNEYAKLFVNLDEYKKRRIYPNDY